MSARIVGRHRAPLIEAFCSPLVVSISAFAAVAPTCIVSHSVSPSPLPRRQATRGPSAQRTYREYSGDRKAGRMTRMTLCAHRLRWRGWQDDSTAVRCCVHNHLCVLSGVSQDSLSRRVPKTPRSSQLPRGHELLGGGLRSRAFCLGCEETTSSTPHCPTPFRGTLMGDSGLLPAHLPPSRAGGGELADREVFPDSRRLAPKAEAVEKEVCGPPRATHAFADRHEVHVPVHFSFSSRPRTEKGQVTVLDLEDSSSYLARAAPMSRVPGWIVRLGHLPGALIWRGERKEDYGEKWSDYLTSRAPSTLDV
ncbi:hypothetical protein B0H13DRAFT_2679785 [Mycena leptocephala]|nr:hypothetical protein B0H13DRAFT_2679785 [Mycena leptocephala]